MKKSNKALLGHIIVFYGVSETDINSVTTHQISLCLNYCFGHHFQYPIKQTLINYEEQWPIKQILIKLKENKEFIRIDDSLQCVQHVNTIIEWKIADIFLSISFNTSFG